MEEEGATGRASDGEKSAGGGDSPLRLCYSALPNKRPEPSGVMTPPPQAPGRVPFRWEEAPGKPRNSSKSSGAKPPAARGLELPPRLASSTWQVAKVADGEVPSKTVLEGTYYVLLPPPTSQVDDMRAEGRDKQLSCSSFTFGDRSFVGGRRRKKRSGAWFWKKPEQKRSSDGDSSSQKVAETDAGLHRHHSSQSCRFYLEKKKEEVETEGAATTATITRHTRSSSLPRLSTATSHLWASVYSGLKQTVGVPWTRKRKPTAPRWQRDSLR